MKLGPFYLLSLIIMIFIAALLDDQEHEIQVKAAEEYAAMLAKEAACEVSGVVMWDCIRNINNLEKQYEN